MNALTRESLFARDSQTLSPLAQQLQQHGWRLVQQSVAHLQPHQWPAVGLVEVRTREQREKLESLLPELRRGHYLAITDPEAMRCRHLQKLVANGFYDYFTWPCDPAQLTTTLGHALGMSALRGTRTHTEQSLLLGDSRQMVQARHRINRFAQSDLPVLLQGESGTGKELVARCLHDFSRRQSKQFVALNCGGLPESLFESEIFGHEAHAFTGAGKRRIGKIEHADGGSLFLDEIESMPLNLQIKLLRVLQEHSLERLGSNQPVAVDCRVIAATKSDLDELGKRGEFRSDLYYRLNVVTLELPPLRERREDIALLFEHFLQLAALRFDRAVPELDRQTLAALSAHDWPGNVRELRNVAERFALGLPVFKKSGQADNNTLGFNEAVEAFERSLLSAALERHAGNLSQAAQTLGMAKTTLFDKVKKYGL